MLIALSQFDKKKTGKVRLKPARPPVKAEMFFRARLEREVQRMHLEVQALANRQTFLKTKYQDLWAAMDKWQNRFDNISQGMGKRLAQDVFDMSKEKLIKQLADRLKVNVDILFDNKKFADMIDTATFEAASLIKSIPSDYIGQVARAVLTHTKQQPLPEGRTLYQQIQHIGGVSKNRAKFIARDQTSKISGEITKFQNKEAGIATYQWSTSRDSRVVGTPGGKYPKGNEKHGNHYKMEGMYCKWDDSTVYSVDGVRWKKRTADMPKGNPQEEIGCRCVAIPVLDRKNIGR
jgi:uncharacterized protein with gpF-like domain